MRVPLQFVRSAMIKEENLYHVFGWIEIMTGSTNPTFICFKKKRVNHFQYTTEVCLHYIQINVNMQSQLSGQFISTLFFRHL